MKSFCVAFDRSDSDFFMFGKAFQMHYLTDNLIPSEHDIVSPHEQADVIECALQGLSLFFTGTAGSGKSYILKELASQLRIKHGEKAVFCTAPTGTSAVNISGQTIHSFAGIGLGGEDKSVLAKRASLGEAGRRWTSCCVLIIDEISMVDGQLFDCLEYIARTVRRCQLPFGGIQLILCGDFFQLPPVDMSKGFAFESVSWTRCVTMHLTLPGNLRQRDPEFAALLERVRTAHCTPADIAWLQSRNDGGNADGVGRADENRSSNLAHPQQRHHNIASPPGGQHHRTTSHLQLIDGTAAGAGKSHVARHQDENSSSSSDKKSSSGRQISSRCAISSTALGAETIYAPRYAPAAMAQTAPAAYGSLRQEGQRAAPAANISGGGGGSYGHGIGRLGSGEGDGDDEGHMAAVGTVLYAANRDVDSVNAQALQALGGQAVRFRALDDGLESALQVKFWPKSNFERPGPEICEESFAADLQHNLYHQV